MTELTRDGERIEMAWSWWHVNKLHEAMVAETPKKKAVDVLFFPSTFVFKEDHTYSERTSTIYVDGDPDEWETFQIKKGDTYKSWREIKLPG